MNQDQAKDFVFETCINPASSDINTLAKTIEPFGFTVTDYDNMSIDLPGRDPCYMVWLRCDHDVKECQRLLQKWLDGLPVFQWTGVWSFVVSFVPPPDVPKNAESRREFDFEVRRWPDGMMQIKKLGEVQAGYFHVTSAYGRKRKPLGRNRNAVMFDDAWLRL